MGVEGPHVTLCIQKTMALCAVEDPTISEQRARYDAHIQHTRLVKEPSSRCAEDNENRKILYHLSTLSGYSTYKSNLISQRCSWVSTGFHVHIALKVANSKPHLLGKLVFILEFLELLDAEL